MLAVVSFAAPAAAQDVGQQSDVDAMAAQFGGDSITIGGGGVYLPDYEGSNDYRFTAAPAAIGSIHGFGFVVLGNRASVDLFPDKRSSKWNFEIGPVGVVDFNRSSTKSIDDVRIKRLGKLGTSIELGGYVGIGKTGVITSAYDRLSVSLSYRHDVSGVHRSGIVQPTINYLTPLSTKSAVAVFASAEHAERGYARSYFGVTPLQSVASGLPIYNARGGWKNYTLGAAGTYSLTGNLLHGFKIVAGGTYTRLINGFSYSPVTRIAGSPNQWLGSVGLAYTF